MATNKNTGKKTAIWTALAAAAALLLVLYLRGLDDVIALAAVMVTAAGVVLVFQQLQSLNQQTRLQNFAEYTRRYQQIVLNFPEDINAEGFSLEDRKGEDGDYDRVMRYMRAYYDLCFEEWYLRQDGLIGDDFWEIWELGIKEALSKRAFQDAWDAMQGNTNYESKNNGDTFPKFVARIIEDSKKG